LGESSLAKKCLNFLSELNYWREAAASTPCDKLIKKLYHEMSLLSYSSSGSRNLTRLYEYAIKFESSGFKGLYGFIKYVNDLIACEVKLPEPPSGESSDRVKIMTIHSSKGLEFPVCFIIECEKNFSTNSSKQDIQYDPDLGIGFTPHDESGFAKFDSPTWRAICDTRRTKELEEEMRLLYVAMTRARERLYLVSNIHRPENKELVKAIAAHDPEYGILRAKSYAEWVMMALDRKGLPDCFEEEELVFVPKSEDGVSDVEDTFVTKEEASVTEVDETLVSTFKERFDFEYPYEHISRLPAKLSVSSLSPGVLDELESGASLAQLDGDFNEVFKNDFATPPQLLGNSQHTAAERGTATHAFLQFCNFDRALSLGIKNEIARLTEERFIAPGYADLIDEKQIEGFFESPLFKRIHSAKRIWREQRFNLFLPASDFTRIEEKSELLKDETIAVQGVIDIFFEDENGRIVLCDYKTDYLTREEISEPTLAAKKLSKRHGEQLSYYAKAVEAMLERAPDEIIIYSLPLKGQINVIQGE
jgi:ATP-dependent helicase/nuclease subunit A